MAIGAPRLGPKPPEVTVPIGAPSLDLISAPSRAGTRPSGRSPTRRRRAPSRNSPSAHSVGIDRNFITVLAGVARAADVTVDAVEARAARGHERHRGGAGAMTFEH